VSAPGAFKDLRRNMLEIGRSKMDRTSKHVALNMILCADEHGVGEPGRDVLAEMCSLDPKTCSRVKRRLNGPDSPLAVEWEEDREKADGSRMTDRYRLSWRPGYGTAVPVPPRGQPFPYTEKTRKNARDPLSVTVTESLLLKDRGVASDPIEEEDEKRTNGLTPIVADEGGEEPIDVTAFVPEAEHHEHLAKLQLDGSAALADFVACHTSRGTRSLAMAQWAKLFTGYIGKRPERLTKRAERERAQLSRDAKPKRGAQPTPSQPEPFTACRVDEARWPAVIDALPMRVKREARGDTLPQIVLRDMGEVQAVTLAVAEALGIAVEVASAAGFTFDDGHRQAVRDFIGKQQVAA